MQNIPLNEDTLSSNVESSQINENFDNITKFELFEKTLLILESTLNKEEIKVFILKLNILTKYMLEDRHSESMIKKTVIARKRDEEGKLLIEKIPFEVLMYKGLNKKERKKNPNPMDVIIFYKQLEQLCLSNKVSVDINNLVLGHFSEMCFELIDSLSKLLISVDQLNSPQKNKAITLLFSSIVIYRQFKVKAIPCINSITDPYDGEDFDVLTKELFTKDSMESWVKDTWSGEVLDQELSVKIYSGNASSPNSGSSAKNLREDMFAIARDLQLIEGVGLVAKHFKNFHEFYFVKGILTIDTETSVNDRPIHSRLFTFTAPGGKARIIANVDWVTQTALSPIHFFLFDLLSKIKSDHTFDHKKGIDHVYKGIDNYYSVDLSSATDRMPRYLQAKLLESIFRVRNYTYPYDDGDPILDEPFEVDAPAEIVRGWSLLVDRLYETKGTRLNNDKPVRYAVGQGMGLFTSWSIMAMLHHYIVNKLCNIPLDNYSLVGDDLVIRGTRDQFENYLNIMKKIGLRVNLNKTIISEGDSCNLEFARNYILKNERIIPLQFGTLFSWRDEKVSLDTFLLTSNWSKDPELLGKFIKTFRAHLTLRKMACIFYHLHKNSIFDLIDWDAVNKIHKLPKELFELNYSKIIDIVKSKRSHKSNKFKEMLIKAQFDETASLIANLSSQLVVRTHEDIIDIQKLSKNLLPLTEVIGVEDVITAIWERLVGVRLIEYDADYLGNPLISNYERYVIEKIIEDKLKH